jgi:hypothetical protein
MAYFEELSPRLLSSDCGRPRETSASVLGVLTEIRTGHLPNTIQDRYDPGSIPGSTRFFSSPQRPDRLWDPPSLLSDWYRGFFARASGRSLTSN